MQYTITLIYCVANCYGSVTIYLQCRVLLVFIVSWLIGIALYKSLLLSQVLLLLMFLTLIVFSSSEPEVRHHLKNVYGAVTIATICAAGGGYAHLYSSIIGKAGLKYIILIGQLRSRHLVPCQVRLEQSIRLNLVILDDGLHVAQVCYCRVPLSVAPILQAVSSLLHRTCLMSSHSLCELINMVFCQTRKSDFLSIFFEKFPFFSPL